MRSACQEENKKKTDGKTEVLSVEASGNAEPQLGFSDAGGSQRE
jgi:hypothetical protein